MHKKPSVALIILIAILIVGGTVAFILLRNIDSEQKSDEITDELKDEFSRAQYFITDWYNELAARGNCQVYLNELRFEDGKYTLTTAKNRIRAVYPRGERYFKLEQITKIEFFEVNSTLRCRLSYGINGEYMFKVK